MIVTDLVPASLLLTMAGPTDIQASRPSDLLPVGKTA